MSHSNEELGIILKRAAAKPAPIFGGLWTILLYAQNICNFTIDSPIVFWKYKLSSAKFYKQSSITHHSKQYYVRLTTVSFFQFIYGSTHEYTLVINVFNNKEIQRIKSENLSYSFTSPLPCPPRSSILLIRSILN